MPTELVVMHPGIATSVQDLGRRGYCASGVPLSGALDPEALALANAVAGNPPDTAALEMLYSGVTLEVRGGSVRVALGNAGAALTRSHGDAKRHVSAWESCTVEPGERLRVGPIRASAAAYLAIEGGLAIDRVMGSLSTCVRARLGGWHGRTLIAGDALPVVLDRPARRSERRLADTPPFGAPAVLRVMPGPHAERYTESALEAFASGEYTVSASSDRSGLRLEGPVLAHRDGYDLASEGLAPGSIQVPGHGQPVILIADQPTVGGYPRIATVIAADLACAGRLRIGGRVRFERVDAAEAKRALLARDAALEALRSSVIEL